MNYQRLATESQPVANCLVRGQSARQQLLRKAAAWALFPAARALIPPAALLMARANLPPCRQMRFLKKVGAEIFKMLKNPYCLDDWYLYDTMVRSVFSLSRDVPHHMVLFVPALCCGWLSYVFRLHVHDIFYLCRQVVTPEMEAFILVTVTNFFNGSSNPSVILHVFTGCSLLSLQYVFVDRIPA